MTVDAGPEPGRETVTRTWLYMVGVALLAVGLVGFIDNPIASQRDDALLRVDTLHSVVHLVTGLVALFIGASEHGRTLAQATIAFGAVYLLILIVTYASPDLFGIFAVPVNDAANGLHLVIAAGSIVAGLAGLGERAIA
jgi:hypothetical protein